MRFQRAVRKGNVWLAEESARDLERPLSLKDALRLLMLYRKQPEKYEKAAARWIARYAAEAPLVTLTDVELVTGLLPWRPASARPGGDGCADRVADANGWRLAA